MTLTGTIFTILDTESGQGKNGEWKKQIFVIETEGEYPKKVAFTAWNAGVEALGQLREGQKVTVSYNPESREYNGKWYTDLKAWKIEGMGRVEQPVQRSSGYSQPKDDDGLPFVLAISVTISFVAKLMIGVSVGSTLI